MGVFALAGCLDDDLAAFDFGAIVESLMSDAENNIWCGEPRCGFNVLMLREVMSVD